MDFQLILKFLFSLLVLSPSLEDFETEKLKDTCSIEKLKDTCSIEQLKDTYSIEQLKDTCSKLPFELVDCKSSPDATRCLPAYINTELMSFEEIEKASGTCIDSQCNTAPPRVNRLGPAKLRFS